MKIGQFKTMSISIKAVILGLYIVGGSVLAQTLLLPRSLITAAYNEQTDRFNLGRFTLQVPANLGKDGRFVAIAHYNRFSFR